MMLVMHRRTRCNRRVKRYLQSERDLPIAGMYIHNIQHQTLSAPRQGVGLALSDEARRRPQAGRAKSTPSCPHSLSTLRRVRHTPSPCASCANPRRRPTAFRCLTACGSILRTPTRSHSESPALGDEGDVRGPVVHLSSDFPRRRTPLCHTGNSYRSRSTQRRQRASAYVLFSAVRCCSVVLPRD